MLLDILQYEPSLSRSVSEPRYALLVFVDS